MKKSVIALAFALAPALQSFAQTTRCSSMEYLHRAEAAYPDRTQLRIQKEAERNQWLNAQASRQGSTVITVPVVFHIIYNDSTQNLSDAIVQSQLDVINEDYRRLNADSSQTPLAFRAVAADCEIQFCLARRTPAGLSTNGIIHKQTNVAAFSNYDDVKFSSAGGDDIWDPNRYLNIWVAAFTNSSFLGIGTFPGSVPPDYDGIVINYKACGRIGNHLMAHYNKGRSLTHEIGHWLNLLHIWADDGYMCSSDDGISDTPLQTGETYGCPSYPRYDSCTSTYPGIMFMNYMDYTDDECMNIFTQGQKARMLSVLNVDRTSILTSNGCLSVGIEENELAQHVSVFPNPAGDRIVIQSDRFTPDRLTLTNVFGQVVKQHDHAALMTTWDLTELSAGIYFLTVTSGETQASFKIIHE